MSTILNCDISGHGPTLVLVHGVAGSLMIWQPIMAQLNEKFTVVRVDLLGYGHSPKPRTDYTPQAHIDAIRETLVYHHIDTPFVMVGLSMGANLVLEYARQWPDECKGIVGIGLPYYADEAAAYEGLSHNVWTNLTLRYHVFAAIIIPFLWGLGRHGLIPTKLFSGVYSPRVAHEALLNPYYAFRSTLIHCMVNYRQDEPLRASSHIRRLFIQGRNDKWVNGPKVDEVLSQFPKTEFVTIPNTSHNTVLAAPAETVTLICDYADSVL
jgi:pimeloyl-ACP methyl ester carboxylesterase